MKQKKKVEYIITNPEIERKIEEGIEKNRKGNFIIRILDKNGQPLQSSDVHYKLISHKFKFGGLMSNLDQFPTKQLNDLYKGRFTRLFNKAILDFSWSAIEIDEGVYRIKKESPMIENKPSPELLLDYCQVGFLYSKVINLASDKNFPSWLLNKNSEESKNCFRNYLNAIKPELEYIDDIELVDDLLCDYSRSNYYKEDDFFESAFDIAKETLGNKNIIVNADKRELDYHIKGDKAKAIYPYYLGLENLLLKNKKYDVISFQFDLNFPINEFFDKTRNYLELSNVMKQLELYQKLGKEIHISNVMIPSFSHKVEDEITQAEILEKLYKLFFSLEKVEEVDYGYLVDEYMPKIEKENKVIDLNSYCSGVLREDLSRKPSYDYLQKLCRNIWHSEGDMRTSQFGEFEFRGFFGEYEIEIDGVKFKIELNNDCAISINLIK